MERIAISDLIIEDKRQREDLGDLQGLAASFAEYGQLQPIVIDHENRLLAGYRRVAAAHLLGWAEIGYERKEEQTLVRRKEIELEENIRRKQLDWKEEVRAIKEIHDLRKAQDPSWTAAKTGELVGKTDRLGQYAVKVADSLHKPEVAGATTLIGAIQRVQALEQFEEKKIEASLRKGLSEYTLLTGDALELIKELADESVDCIITDPPFGIGLNYRGEKKFADSRAATMAMMREIIPELYRVLRNDSWCIIFFDLLKILDEVKESTGDHQPLSFGMWWAEPGLAKILEWNGFEIVGMPAIWYKPNKVTSTGRNPSKFLSTVYEAMVIAAKGDPYLSRKGRPNVFAYDSPPQSERFHGTQKSAELGQELVETFSVAGQLIFDPFAGSAAFGVGALRAQRKYLGIEIDPDTAEKAEVALETAHD